MKMLKQVKKDKKSSKNNKKHNIKDNKILNNEDEYKYSFILMYD